MKNHDRRRVYLQLVNVSYKATEEDVKDFYKNQKYSGIYSKKEGSFQFEFDNKDDAIAFIEHGAGVIDSKFRLD